MSTNADGPCGSALSEGLGRCGKCKHWQRYSSDFEVGHHGKHAGTCKSDKFVYDEGPQPPQDGLRYWDYEGYSAGFDTGEDFGCVHWAACIGLRPNVEFSGVPAGHSGNHPAGGTSAGTQG